MVDARHRLIPRVLKGKCFGLLFSLSVGDLKWRLRGRLRAEVSGLSPPQSNPGKSARAATLSKSRLTVAGNPKLMVALASLNLPATRLHATCFSKKNPMPLPGEFQSCQLRISQPGNKWRGLSI